MRSRLVPDECASEYKTPKAIVDASMFRVSEPLSVRPRSVLGGLGDGPSLLMHSPVTMQHSPAIELSPLFFPGCLFVLVGRRQPWRV